MCVNCSNVLIQFLSRQASSTQALHQFHPVKMKLSTSLAIAAAASSATAHTIFVSLNGGAVGDGVRVPSYDGVSFPLTSGLPRA